SPPRAGASGGRALTAAQSPVAADCVQRITGFAHLKAWEILFCALETQSVYYTPVFPGWQGLLITHS
ncbi:hypothetical protein NE584_16705, partial [Clostridium sp. DFI.5.61]|uniref:hypothetical protein n=1 Tax=Clostridium sp. DFI.5.61 TaxID=2965279 RepID=UPI00210E043E